MINPNAYKFSFSEAVIHLKHGEKVTRSGWNGRKMFLYLVDGSNCTVNRKLLNTIRCKNETALLPDGTDVGYQPHINMKTADGSIVPWVASQSDILCNDWEFA